MLIEQRRTVPLAIEPLWELLIDPARVSRCMPGLEAFAETSPDQYEGRVRVKVGPISLRLQGRLVVHERDRARWTARMSAEGKDSRIAGAVAATMTMSLARGGAAETELVVLAEATVLGKLGEFGQPIMKKSADRIMQQFVQNVTEAMANGQGGRPEAGDAAILTDERR
jgi:carbon monoxide dehydrogenase subunit G